MRFLGCTLLRSAVAALVPPLAFFARRRDIKAYLIHSKIEPEILGQQRSTSKCDCQPRDVSTAMHSSKWCWSCRATRPSVPSYAYLPRKQNSSQGHTPNTPQQYQTTPRAYTHLEPHPLLPVGSPRLQRGFQDGHELFRACGEASFVNGDAIVDVFRVLQHGPKMLPRWFLLLLLSVLRGTPPLMIGERGP